MTNKLFYVSLTCLKDTVSVRVCCRLFVIMGRFLRWRPQIITLVLGHDFPVLLMSYFPFSTEQKPRHYSRKDQFFLLIKNFLPVQRYLLLSCLCNRADTHLLSYKVLHHFVLGPNFCLHQTQVVLPKAKNEERAGRRNARVERQLSQWGRCEQLLRPCECDDSVLMNTAYV